MVKLIGPCLLVVFISACSPKDIDTAAEQNAKTFADTALPAYSSSFHPLACEVLASFPQMLDTIRSKSRDVLNGHDSCVLMLIDSVYLRYVATGEEQYMDCMKAIAGVSDGYVSDYLTDVAVDIFMKRPAGFVPYLLRSDSGVLKQLLIWGMHREIFFPSGVISGRAKIDSVVDDQLRRSVLSRSEKRYLAGLRRQWLKKEDQ